MARQIKSELSLEQEEKGGNASATRILGIFRSASALQTSKSSTTIPLQIGENPEKLGEKPNLEVAKTVAETLLRRARTLQ